MNELISVIVPIYGVEKYLNRCIESIVNQTYKNMEIILIDDGSPDQCPEICDRWVKKDQRIKVVHKKNGGLSDARNAGIKFMTGEYVAFIDSDDWIEKHMFQVLLHTIKETNADMCECEYQISTGKQTKSEHMEGLKVLTINKYEALKAVVDQEIAPVVWNKLYRRKIVERVYFPEGKCNEDEFWTYKVVDRCQKVSKVNTVLYYYFKREESIINERYSLKRLDGLDGRYERMNYLKKYKSIYELAKRKMFFECMFHYQMSLKYLNEEDLVVSSQKIKNIYKNLDIKLSDFFQYDMKEKIWFILGKISFKNTCKFRNYINYGV